MQRRNRCTYLLCALTVVVFQVQAGSTAVNVPAENPILESRPGRAYFAEEHPSQEARHVADWVVHSRDNAAMPFMIIDKKEAHAFLFDKTGQLQGASPVLLGSAKGDDSVPGIGDRKLADIRAHERTTPAGRFVASLSLNLRGKDILWVDYDAAISLHRVVTSNAKEGRAQRLSTPTPADNRISYGCINVPISFFENLVSPAFKASNGVVYVLPDVKSPSEVFGSYEISGTAVASPLQ